MQIYVAEKGDNLTQISERFGVDQFYLAWVNQISYPYRLAVGQALLIPELRQPIGAGNGGDNGGAANVMRLGGYAYPWIDQTILEETCQHLTSISIFSYGFTENGDLILPDEEGERRILETAVRFDVNPILVLTPLDSEGRFNNELVSILLEDIEIQEQLFWALWAQIQEKNYQGINIDFEYVHREDRELLVQFVERMRRMMNLEGRTISVAVAPKTSADQRGQLYEGIDYEALGSASDEIFLMTYEWGYTFGTPMAVAPVHLVRRVVEYAVSEIEPEKITLGIPNYGYDWPLPFVQGTTRATSIGTMEAIQLAIEHEVPILYDETAQSPYFHYWQDGIQHEVWFEDVRSIQAKFDLVKEFGLSGAGYWQLMRLYRPNWLLAYYYNRHFAF